jgi:8-oxo-dGTP pyrophosphatase MutT (NUDIX family)
VTGIRTLSTRVVYENPWVRVREDAIERADGSPGVYAVVDKNEGALVVPWDGERVTLVGQVKYPVGGFFWEFPQGAIDHENAAPQDTARAELVEETGLTAGRLEHLGRLFYSYGLSSQGFDLWLATDLVQGEARPESTEVGIETRAVTRDEFDAMVRSGEIADAASLAAWELLRVRGISLS